MPHFTKHIDTSIGRLEFFFNRIYTVNGTRYHVSVKDGKRVTYTFYLETKNDTWQVVKVPTPPDWILAVESDLARVVEKH